MIKTSHCIQLYSACTGLGCGLVWTWFTQPVVTQRKTSLYRWSSDLIKHCVTAGRSQSLFVSVNQCVQARDVIRWSVLRRNNSHSVHVEVLKRRCWEFGMKRVDESILPCQGLCFLQACVRAGACVSRWERGSDSFRAAFCLWTELVAMPWRHSACLFLCV